MLFYPYPLDTLYCKVDSSFAISLIDEKETKGNESEKGFGFAIKIPPDSVRAYRLGYQQQVKVIMQSIFLQLLKVGERLLNKFLINLLPMRKLLSIRFHLLRIHPTKKME